MRKQTVIVYALVASAAVFVGCSGGGQQASVPSTLAGPNAPAAPQGMSKATFTLTIPNGSSASGANRNPAYISANTASMSIAVATGSGTPGPATTTNLTAGSPGCTTGSSGTTCAVTVSAPIGTDTFVVTLYSAANGGGSVLSSAAISGSVVVAATANSFPITLNGTVASVAVSVTNGNNLIPGGYATTLPVVVTAKDASGATIIGPGNYTNPITLTNADTSGTITALSTTTVTSPATAVTLTYAPNDTNGGVLDIASLPVGATTISATASGVSGSAITPGTFQYIADRFFGFNHTRTLTGTATETITNYNASGVPSPSPSTWTFSITDTVTEHTNTTFNGVVGLANSHHVETVTQLTPTTAASPYVDTNDQYHKAVLTATGAIVYQYFVNHAVNNTLSISTLGSNLSPGTSTLTNTYSPSQWEEDVLPHTSTSWSDNFIPLGQAATGTTILTRQFNADGSWTFSESAPASEQITQAANGLGTQFNPGTGVTITVAVPQPSGTGMVVPVTMETTSPAPGPTSTFFPVDWYPNGGVFPSPTYANTYTLALVSIPVACNVPSTIATQAYAVAWTENWLRPTLFSLDSQVQTDYYVPGGIGWVCQTLTQTVPSYRLTTGVISQQTAVTWAFGVQNANSLSVRRRP